MRTRLKANCIGALAAKSLLGEESEVIGSVVSAFPNSFYVRTIKNELIFITSRQVKSPITINLDSAGTFGQLMKPLEPVSVAERTIHVGDDTTIDMPATMPSDNAPGFEDSLAGQFALSRETLNTSSTILMIVDNNQSVLDPKGLVHEGAKEFVHKGIIPQRGLGKPELFSEVAMKIVGLGLGFTPSGDDVLGGFLATYNSLAANINRPKMILDFSAVQTKTTWISAKLMDFMQRQVLDDQIQQLIRSAKSGSKEEFILALETILPRGHTSGIDIAVGAILALCLILDTKRNERKTEGFVKRIGLL